MNMQTMICGLRR